jgi:hypothetical protein
MVTKLKEQYDADENQSSIRKIDEKLSILRESWQDAGEDKKNKWMKMINEELDQRLTLMSIRDNMA